MATLDPMSEKFVLHWGEMGTRWGVNRTVAQIHALLYLSPEPLNAEDIASTLSIARSNVSTSLRELEGWGIVKAVHILGDRREHYQTMKDVWEMARVILAERKRREIDPTLGVLRECVAAAEKGGKGEAQKRQRLKAMLEFVEMVTSLYTQMSSLPTGAIQGLLSAQGKLRSLFSRQEG
jgi:DNA-binding transcriptional regulator GbsR (MarR family)